MTGLLAAFVAATTLTLFPVETPAEPYGGCKEAVDYPGTQGARDCGWTPMPGSQLRLGHAGCWWLVGPTTYVSCPDGYRTTS